jgi:TDG/mug DNA glycosylase family protein
VFIGYNPGLESARRGHYYAFNGNAFWRQLNESGLVLRPVTFEDDHLLLDLAGIGFTDLCPRPTLRAEELTAAERREGALRLHTELVDAHPDVAVFSGKGIYHEFARHALGLHAVEVSRTEYGPQPERLADGEGGTTVWVIPSSSGLASRWHARRLELLRSLAAGLNSVPAATSVTY